MTVAELIELLKAMPPDAVVGFVNNCADYGDTFTHAGEPEFRRDTRDRWTRYPSNLPDGGAVLL